jgi:hypothetical protein
MTKFVSRASMLRAIKAVLSAGGLSPGEKAVGCAIISHFNEDTGQCDPGATRLAKLIGVKRDTVFAAIRKLGDGPRAPGQEVEPRLGLISYKTYGGKAHRNAYAPDWERADEAAKAWDRRRSGTVKASREQSPMGDGQQSPMGDTNDTDHKRTKNLVDGLGRAEAGSGQAGRSVLKRSAKRPAQGYLLHSLDFQHSPSHQEAAHDSQQRRLARRIESLPRDQRAAAWLAAMQEAPKPQPTAEDEPGDGREAAAAGGAR